MNDVVRSARALGWLRWRIFVNTLRGTRRRDTLESLSRAGSVIVPIVLGVMFVPAFLLSCVLSLVGGWAVGQGISATPTILGALRGVLIAVTAVILFVPAIRTARGQESTNLVRLALLPLPRKVLHFSDLLSGLTDPWITLAVPVMLLFPVGIAFSGRVLVGLIALVSGIALLLVFLTLESSVSSLLALLYRDRRRGEIVTLVLLLTLSFTGFLPMLFSQHFEDQARQQRGRPRAGASRTGAPTAQGETPAPPPMPGAGAPSGAAGPPRPDGGSDGSGPSGAAAASGNDRPSGTPSSPFAPAPGARPDSGSTGSQGPSPSGSPWVVVFHFSSAAFSFLPSEFHVRAISEPLRGRTGMGLLGVLGVSAIGAVLYAFSWVTYKRLLDSPENISPRRGSRAEPAVWRLPGLGAAPSAVAQAQFRLVLRTVHGKMAILFTPVSVLFAGVVISRVGRGGIPGGAWALPTGPLFAYGGTTFALLAPQRFLLNLFATDGAGLTLAFLSPLSDRQIVVGKSVGMALLTAIPMLIIASIVALISPPAPIALWAAVFVSIASAYMVLAPAGALISAIFPKTVNMNRLSGASNPNGIASMLGLALTAASCGPPALIASVTYLATQSPLLVLLAALGYAAIAAGLSFLLIHAAAKVVAARRENLALVAQGR